MSAPIFFSMLNRHSFKKRKATVVLNVIQNIFEIFYDNKKYLPSLIKTNIITN